MADFVIESFGGYEKAKAVLDIPNAHFLHNIEGLKQRLLEYRHQHNIFEVGDLVTHLTTRDILKVISIEDSNKHYRFIKVKAINPENQESVNEFNSLWFQLKHATDAEIKAGRRLEVNTIDSDIDKQVNLMDQFIADGGFDKAFVDVFGLPESVKKSLKEIS